MPRPKKLTMPRKRTPKPTANKPADLKFPQVETEDEREQQIAEMRLLLASPAWGFIANILEENIKIKESEILDDHYDKEKLYDEGDRLKDQRKFMLKLLNLPAEQIGLLSLARDEDDEDDGDPYFKNKEK